SPGRSPAARSPTSRSATRASTSPTAGTTSDRGTPKMFDLLRARLRQGHRTTPYPDGPAPALPDRFRGLPVLDASRCADGCRQCADACPTGALRLAPLALDLGRCLFCTDCVRACPTG